MLILVNIAFDGRYTEFG